MIFAKFNVKISVLSLLATLAVGLFFKSFIICNLVEFYEFKVKFYLSFEQHISPEEEIEAYVVSDNLTSGNQSLKKRIDVSESRQKYRFHIQTNASDLLHSLSLYVGEKNDVFTIDNVAVNNESLDESSLKLYGLEQIDKNKYKVLAPNAYLTFTPKSKISTGFKINQAFLPYLFSIGIILFLLFYWCFLFISKQSKEYNFKLILIVMLFFTVVIPFLYFDNSEISTKEKRKLAEFKPFISADNKLNENFTKDFDNYLSDRYGFREHFMRIQSVKDKVNPYIMTDMVFLGYNNMLFYKNEDDADENTVYYAAGLIQRTPIKTILDKAFIKDFLSKLSSNSNVVLLMAPAKSQVYPENYRILRKNYVKDYSEILTVSGKQIPFIHPLRILDEHKKDGKVFWYHDSHWTSFGACLAFSEVAKPLNLNFNSEQCLKWKEGNTERMGDLDTLLPHGITAPGLDHSFHNEDFAAQTSKLKCTVNEEYVHCINPSPLSNKTVIGIGDSQFFLTDFRQYVTLAYKESILMSRSVDTHDEVLLDLVKKAKAGEPDFILEGAERFVDSRPFEDDFIVLNKLLFP